jgi:leucyl-tRNA synthetase
VIDAQGADDADFHAAEWQEWYGSKEGKLVNSGEFDGLDSKLLLMRSLQN